MSTFDEYADRIDSATVQLEADVTAVSEYTGNLTNAVNRAETAAGQAEDARDEILESKPLFKGEYGSVENYTSRIILESPEAFENFYGYLFKAQAGCTGISLNALPATDVDGFHCYVRNDSGASISVTSTVGDVDLATIPNGSFVRISLDALRANYEVINYSTEGSESPVRYEELVNTLSSVNQIATVTNTPQVLQFGTAQGTLGDPVSFDGNGVFNINQTGQYIIYASANIGRVAGSGVATMKIGALINGVPTSNPRLIRLGNASSVVPFSATFTVNLEASDIVQFYIEDEGGTNDIGVIAATDAPTSPSVSASFSRITGAIVSGAGGSFDWTTIPEATETMKGLMSAEDKIKLNIYPETGYANATTTASGLMSSADKIKLNGIPANAEQNVNSDWDATSGDALILNKPVAVTQGNLVYNPNTEEYEYDGSGADGLMTSPDKVKLENNTVAITDLDGRVTTLENSSGGGGGIADAPLDGESYVRNTGAWVDVDTLGFIGEAPLDGQQYARQSGGWTVVTGGTGGGGGGNITFENMLTAGQGYEFNPVTETTTYCIQIDITDATDWLNARTSAGWLMNQIWGTTDIRQIDFQYREVPVFVRNSYAGRTNHTQAPWGASDYNWITVKVIPYMFTETRDDAYSNNGSNAMIEITYYSDSVATVRTNGSTTTIQAGGFPTNPARKYFNITKSADTDPTLGTTTVVYYYTQWQEMTATAVVNRW